MLMQPNSSEVHVHGSMVSSGDGEGNGDGEVHTALLFAGPVTIGTGDSIGTVPAEALTF